MEWLHITANELQAAAEEHNVCIVPLGCLEKHSDHLPLGTDSLLAYTLACLGAADEPAVVFPAQHYTMVASASANPGAVAFDAKLAMQILETCFEEIARNGFTKIILYNFHGGNRNISRLLLQNHLARQPQPYALYLPDFDWEVEDVYAEYCESDFGGHADEWETSLMLHLFPDSVDMQAVPSGDTGEPQHRLTALREAGVSSPLNFYADFPTHYAGNAAAASAETGKRAVNVIRKRLAGVIKAVKADDASLELQAEFAEKAKTVSR